MYGVPYLLEASLLSNPSPSVRIASMMFLCFLLLFSEINTT